MLRTQGGSVLGLLVLCSCQRSPVAPEPGPGPAPEPAPASEPTTSLTPPPFVIEPTQELPASPELLATGATLYARRCAPCHGERGAGDGPAAYLLYPKPRNFRTAQYRFVSTWESMPTDRDLYRTISRGIPGSAMPSWAHLTERDRWALVHYVKGLAEEPIVVAPGESDDPLDGEGIIKVAAEPPNDAASVAKGAALFAISCKKCHGEKGRGDGEASTTLKDDDNIPIRPRDLTTGVFKGSPEPEHLYRRIVHGIPATPMPENPMLMGDDIWHLVHFVRSLSSDRLRERAEMKRYRIPVVRVPKLPVHPDAGEWRVAPKVELHLMPLWWRYNRPEYLAVRAVHDGQEIAFLLMWADDTKDDLLIRTEDFRDGAALELAAANSDPPFFAMGEQGHPVNIWMWKSERQANLEGFHDLEAQYPNIGIDSYPNLQKSPYEQPMRHALTLKSDPTFITAWGAGNIVSDPTRHSAAEDLRAHGFGTLRANSEPDQEIRAHGEHSHGSYRVMFSRALKGSCEDALDLTPGTSALVAFAIWNGSAGDRDGKKSVTIWQDLDILR